jgi:hypothetical protein
MWSAWRYLVEELISVPTLMCRLSMAYLTRSVRREKTDRPGVGSVEDTDSWLPGSGTGSQLRWLAS